MYRVDNMWKAEQDGTRERLCTYYLHDSEIVARKGSVIHTYEQSMTIEQSMDDLN
ncbi:hypothetical protein M413DRAFT_449685 [Hebeloma cylindrosporum]|uniref:Uncharacterized protein n=1 Tax=Hebeloma cylindrosporum TaxID=76867 RepID=A0A0C3BVW1_HEBCY|nr:hypothetical protein M413DRAFT_449685 [Hebeloma cylindrosporum h7]